VDGVMARSGSGLGGIGEPGPRGVEIGSGDHHDRQPARLEGEFSRGGWRGQGAKRVEHAAQGVCEADRAGSIGVDAKGKSGGSRSGEQIVVSDRDGYQV
jgi:hypothetical protein